ncbi:MAG: methionyl-tRNA formyltransferase [Acidobacteria bacterium]|nr:MAG: methionyl-tRNA formyltransferase [Acidobacteriota bacterium]
MGQGRHVRLIFLGTPDFAVPSLVQLQLAGHAILLTLCQPDRPAGRGKQMRMCAVKRKALTLGLPVYQPETLDTRVSERITLLNPDVAVVVAYGLILPRQFLEIPRWGCVNLHASALPRYRGASPIAHAILKGEKMTGVTTVLIDEGIDTGQILLQSESPIGEEETTGEVAARLAILGADLLVETLRKMEQGTLRPRVQQVEYETYAPKIHPESGQIRWNQDARTIARRVRALNPRPGAFTMHRGRQVKIWHATVPSHAGVTNLPPGSILEEPKLLRVACGDGSCLEVREVQLEGRRRVSGEEAMRGRWFAPGERFDETTKDYPAREGSQGNRLPNPPEP